MQQMPKQKISVVGTGYVGLVTAVCLAEKGHYLVCVDKDEEKILTINAGKSPIHEKGLDELLQKHINKNVFGTIDLPQAVQQTDVTFIAVGTPFDGEHIDLTYIRQAAAEIGHALKNKSTYHVVVVKSTVVPGTTYDVVKPILESTSQKQIGKDFGLCMNPEFLREGEAVNDFLNPDRIVIGGLDEQSTAALTAVYAGFVGTPIIKTSTQAAELIKYTSNAFFATLISFANEIANLCSQLPNVDAMEVMEAFWLDRRITPMSDKLSVRPGLVDYLKPGCGFGGSCFPKDINALVAYGKQQQKKMTLLESVIEVNNLQPMQMLALLQKYFPHFKNIKIGILGVAFKPGTDDIRCSPAIHVIHELNKHDANVYVYDPVVKTIPAANVVFTDTMETLIKTVNVVMIFTAWPDFQRVPALLTAYNPKAIVIDGRRILGKKDVLHYEGIGINLSPLNLPISA